MADTLAPQDLDSGHAQYPEVKPQRLMLGIPDIKRKLFFPGYGISPVNLRPPGYAGLHLMPARLLRGVPAKILHEQRARPHEAHLAEEHIQKRRQLIQACGAQKIAEAGNAPSVKGCAFLARPGMPHGAKLVKVKRPAFKAGALLTKQDRRPHGAADRKSNTQDYGCCSAQKQKTHGAIKAAFNCFFKGAHHVLNVTIFLQRRRIYFSRGASSALDTLNSILYTPFHSTKQFHHLLCIGETMKPACTKIVATVGPACESPEMIRRLIDAGADVFRLNFSHGTYEAHARCIATIRRAADAVQAPIAILQDLQGPRIRTGMLKGHAPVELVQNSEVTLRVGDFEGDENSIAVGYERFAADVVPGERILISDGLIELTVLSRDSAEARCRVVSGGMLGERKGINLPGSNLSISSPTEKDISDLAFGIEHGIDFVALSFVEKAADILRLKQEIHRLIGPDDDIPVIAKIERPRAVDNLYDILKVADGVMVARGDLGIEMPAEAVPPVQKKIIRMANQLGIPAITATQMLDSMISAPRPTRAEASDVANAILDGTDAVMLSGETSAGRYPAEAVTMMNSIAFTTEELRRSEGALLPPEFEMCSSAQQAALSKAVCAIAHQLQSDAIVVFTMTGSMARCVSQRRPDAPVYAFTPNARTYRHLSLLWGVRAVLIDAFETTDQMIETGGRRLLELGLAARGDTVIYVAGGAAKTPGGTDMIKIHRFPDEAQAGVTL